MNVNIKTNHGSFNVELDTKNAPITVNNFVNYVNSGHFNNTIFHRVINDFMIQGGGFDMHMEGKPTSQSIKNEANNGLKNDKYTIAMARTQDPHSATNQFFINVVNNDFLNFKSETLNGWGYAVFGKVTEGFDVIDKIKQVNTTSVGYHENVPIEHVIIESATVII